MSKKLTIYDRKRRFNETPEPRGKIHKKKGLPIFVIQKHDARSLHYDLRLEDEGVLKSWAIPKGPSMDPSVKHLAVQTEDHPYDYKDFEGVIPEGNYGAGGVIIWDKGTYRNLEPLSLSECIKKGNVAVWLDGEKLHGGFALIHTHLPGKDNWLFFKMKDEEAQPDSKENITEKKPNSVVSGKSVTYIEKHEDTYDKEPKKQYKKR